MLIAALAINIQYCQTWQQKVMVAFEGLSSFFFERFLALLLGISFQTTTLIYEQVLRPVLS
jgi:hypothetical protein